LLATHVIGKRLNQGVIMGLLNEIVGAVLAEETLKKADPGAGLLKEGLAALAGFEGEKFVENKLSTHADADANADADVPDPNATSS
jgi:hypothetical protein